MVELTDCQSLLLLSLREMSGSSAQKNVWMSAFYSVIYSGNFCSFFNHQLSHQMLNEGGTLYPTPHRNECHMPWVTFWDTIGQV